MAKTYFLVRADKKHLCKTTIKEITDAGLEVSESRRFGSFDVWSDGRKVATLFETSEEATEYRKGV